MAFSAVSESPSANLAKSEPNRFQVSGVRPDSLTRMASCAAKNSRFWRRKNWRGQGRGSPQSRRISMQWMGRVNGKEASMVVF